MKCKDCKSFVYRPFSRDCCKKLKIDIGNQSLPYNCLSFELKYLGKAYEEADVQPGDKVFLYGDTSRKAVVATAFSIKTGADTDSFIWIREPGSKYIRGFGPDIIIKKDTMEKDISVEKVNKQKLIDYVKSLPESSWYGEDDGYDHYFYTEGEYSLLMRKYSTLIPVLYSIEINEIKLKETDISSEEVGELYIFIEKLVEDREEVERVEQINELINNLGDYNV